MAYIDQTPRDENGLPHGEWLIYYDHGRLIYRYNYVHGIEHGLYEWYNSNNKICYRGYYNMGNKIGCWYWYDEKRYLLCLI